MSDPLAFAKYIAVLQRADEFFGPGVVKPAKRELPTHCPAGHEYTPENTYMRAHGARRCRKCQNARYLAASGQPGWTDADDLLLRELYPFSRIEDVVEALQRSPNAIRLRAHRLGLKKADGFHGKSAAMRGDYASA